MSVLEIPEVVYVRWMWCQSCQCIRPLRLHQASPHTWQCRTCQVAPLELVK
jgi:hypothetical protein